MNFNERSKIYLARMDALTQAERWERGFRRSINGAIYLAAGTYLAFAWPTISAPSLLVTFVLVVAARTIGNVIVGVWAQREAARIEEATPMPATEWPGNGDKP